VCIEPAISHLATAMGTTDTLAALTMSSKARTTGVSPFELESVLMEHHAIAESAVVPSRDDQRWTVPKAFVVLKPDVEPTAQIAQDILAFVRERMGLINEYAALSLRHCPRRFPARFDAWNCVCWKMGGAPMPVVDHSNIGKKISWQ